MWHMCHMCPKCFGGKNMPKSFTFVRQLHPSTIQRRLDVFYLVGGVCTRPTGGKNEWGQEAGRWKLRWNVRSTFKFKDGVSCFHISSHTSGKGLEDSRVCFFHHCNSTPKALKPKRVWNLWSSFDTATLHAGSFLLSMGTIKTWKSNFHGKREHWGTGDILIQTWFQTFGFSVAGVPIKNLSSLECQVFLLVTGACYVDESAAHFAGLTLLGRCPEV